MRYTSNHGARQTARDSGRGRSARAARPTGLGRGTFAFVSALAAVLALGTRAGGQSTDPSSYVLLARESIRLTRLEMRPGLGGHVGVGSGGVFFARHLLEAPGYQVAAPVIRIDGQASCGELYGDDVRGANATCGPPQPYVAPFDDLAATCDFPAPFPACGTTPVVVPHGQTLELPPGSYGDVRVEGGAGGPGTLRLAGEYSFCNLDVARRGRVEVTQPTVLHVEGALRTSTAAVVGPAAGSGLGAQDLRIFLAGPRVRISRRGSLRAHVFAPQAQLNATSATLAGRFVANAIRAKRVQVELSPSGGTTTTTTTIEPSTTTTTTTDPCAIACGKPECNPVCAPEDDSPCGAFAPLLSEPPSSCEGAIIGVECSRDCSDDCKTLTFARCEVPTTTTLAGSTSTTVTATTTTSSAPTVTTTLPPSPAVEICGNCVDDDGDGDVDLADDDCCQGTGQFASQVRRARIRARKDARSLRLRSILASGGLAVDPRVDEVSLVISSGSPSGALLCATVPPGKMRKVGRGWRVNNKRAKLESLQGLATLRLKQRKNGQLRFRTAGKRVRFTAAPQPGELDVTVGFRLPSSDGATNRCARARIRIEPTRNRKALRYP